MTPDEVRMAQIRYEQALAQAEAARVDRNCLVAVALAQGWTHAQIAEATGLSRGRVSQIR